MFHVTTVKSAPRTALAFALLLAALGLNAYTLHSASSAERVEEKAPPVLLPDPLELAARLREVSGSYATGSQPGDRVITVTADGKIHFSELGPREKFTRTTDTFQLSRRDPKFCLITAASGVIDLLNPDTLLYFRDTYRRTK